MIRRASNGTNEATREGAFLPLSPTPPMRALLIPFEARAESRSSTAPSAAPAVLERMEQVGFGPVGSSPAEFQAHVKPDAEKFGLVFRAADIQP